MWHTAGASECNLTCDELAIFDADLSPNDTAVGQASQRFMDMYNMGIN